MNIQCLENRLSELNNWLKSRGLQIDVMVDEAKVSRLFADMGEKRSHPVSEVTRSDLLHSRALWFGMRDNSQYFTCISARLDCLGGQSFSAFWELHCAKKYPDRHKLIVDVNRELNACLSGNLIYFGGVEVADGYKGNIRRLSVFNEFVRCYASIKWQYDWMYTIVSKEHRPLRRLYGLDVVYDNAIIWRDPVPDGLNNHQAILAANRGSVVGKLTLSTNPR